MIYSELAYVLAIVWEPPRTKRRKTLIKLACDNVCWVGNFILLSNYISIKVTYGTE